MISAYVDRIEENLAVILLGENEDYQIEIPSNLLPEDLAEGSYINIEISIDKKKTQDALKEAANAQKKVAQAEAEKNAAAQTAEAELIKAQKEAEAQLVKAQKEAEARKVRADAIAYENQRIVQNLSVMQAQWKHEEEMARLEKWDGVQVSSQSIYVPNTYDLKSGK